MNSDSDELTGDYIGEPKYPSRDYVKGYNEALDYVLERGQSILEHESITEDVAIGICLILGIAKVERDKK